MNYTSLYKKITDLHGLIPYKFFNGYAFRPVNVLFELTYRCNLRCSMCQFLPLVKEATRITKQRPDIELSCEEIKNTIIQFSKSTLLSFTGGEPFLRKDIFDILTFAASNHKCHLITNGTLVNQDIASRLIDLSAANIMSSGLIMTEISLEGTESVHDSITAVSGSFKKTVNCIKMLVRLKKEKKLKYPLINIAVVMTSKNVHILPDMVRLAEDLGVDILSFLTHSNFPHFERLKNEVKLNNSEHIENLTSIDKNLLKKQIDSVLSCSSKNDLEIRFSPHGIPVNKIIDYYAGNLSLNEDISFNDYLCKSPWSKTVINSRGDVVPCSNYVIGNIREQSLSKIWNGSKARQFRQKLKSKGIFSHCLGCCMLESK